MADELWDGDDQMPSCAPCLRAEHENCADLIWTHPFGLHACGCRNPEHQEDE
jgi:hypothetical protein